MIDCHLRSSVLVKNSDDNLLIKQPQVEGCPESVPKSIAEKKFTKETRDKIRKNFIKPGTLGKGSAPAFCGQEVALVRMAQPVLVRLTNVKQETTSVKYRVMFPNYFAKGVSKVIRVKDEVFTYIVVQPKKTWEDWDEFETEEAIPLSSSDVSVIPVNTEFGPMIEVEGGQNDVFINREMLLHMVARCPEPVKLSRTTSVLVELVPVNCPPNKFGHGFVKSDTFTVDYSVPSKHKILNEFFVVLKDGTKYTRVVMGATGEWISNGDFLGAATMLGPETSKQSVKLFRKSFLNNIIPLFEGTDGMDCERDGMVSLKKPLILEPINKTPIQRTRSYNYESYSLQSQDPRLSEDDIKFLKNQSKPDLFKLDTSTFVIARNKEIGDFYEYVAATKGPVTRKIPKANRFDEQRKEEQSSADKPEEEKEEDESNEIEETENIFDENAPNSDNSTENAPNADSCIENTPEEDKSSENPQEPTQTAAVEASADETSMDQEPSDNTTHVVKEDTANKENEPSDESTKREFVLMKKYVRIPTSRRNGLFKFIDNLRPIANLYRGNMQQNMQGMGQFSLEAMAMQQQKMMMMQAMNMSMMQQQQQMMEQSTRQLSDRPPPLMSVQTEKRGLNYRLGKLERNRIRNDPEARGYENYRKELKRKQDGGGSEWDDFNPKRGRPSDDDRVRRELEQERRRVQALEAELRRVKAQQGGQQDIGVLHQGQRDGNKQGGDWEGGPDSVGRGGGGKKSKRNRPGKKERLANPVNNQRGNQSNQGGNQPYQGGDQSQHGGDQPKQERNHPHQRGERSFQGGNKSCQGGNQSYQGGHQSYQGRNQSYQGGNQSYQGGHQSYQGGNKSFQGGNQSLQGGNQSYQDRNQSFLVGSQSYQGGNQSYQGGKQSYQGGNQSYQGGNQPYQNQAYQGRNQSNQHGNQSFQGGSKPYQSDNQSYQGRNSSYQGGNQSSHSRNQSYNQSSYQAQGNQSANPGRGNQSDYQGHYSYQQESQEHAPRNQSQGSSYNQGTAQYSQNRQSNSYGSYSHQGYADSRQSRDNTGYSDSTGGGYSQPHQGSDWDTSYFG